MRDMVVLLPGITGSVLTRDGEDLWAISGSSLAGFLKSRGKALQALALPEDYDPARPPDDGISASRVFRNFHGVFGLGKIDGYSALDALIREQFEIVPGTDDENEPANYFEFAYDWRLSNRLNAGRLKAFIDPRLHTWRKHTSPDAKVILLAHSMGGLVSRYYIECLDGWHDCRALVTFGTPYRGSLSALDFLANGYKQLFIDLTNALRSFPSVYELLPIYPALQVDGSFKRVHEADGIPFVSRPRAQAANAFHREIEGAVGDHLDNAKYLRDRYRIFPVVGVKQPTLQSARFDGAAVAVLEDRPPIVDAPLAGGDGTVPRVSATPIEYSSDYRETFFVEKHGSLQNNLHALQDLAERLKQLQAGGLQEVRGTWQEHAPERPALCVRIEDVYIHGEEPVRVRVTVEDPPPALSLVARLEQLDGPRASETTPLTAQADGWEFSGDHLLPGAYRITIASGLRGDAGPTPVRDVFEIVAAERV
jgi:pimeloyl-ACP methyl ester carboxylesterase